MGTRKVEILDKDKDSHSTQQIRPKLRLPLLSSAELDTILYVLMCRLSFLVYR